MYEVLVNRLGGLSLPRKSVVRLTDRPEMTLDVYRGRKTTTTSWLAIPRRHFCFDTSYFICVFFFFFSFCFWLVSLLLCLFVLYVILAQRPPALQCQLPALFLLFVVFLPTFGLSGEPKQNQGRGLVDRKLLQALPPPVILLFFCFGCLVVSDVVCRYLSLWLNWWVSFAPDFQCCISVSPLVCFMLHLILISMFQR